jgi:hypothetical protein
MPQILVLSLVAGLVVVGGLWMATRPILVITRHAFN